VEKSSESVKDNTDANPDPESTVPYLWIFQVSGEADVEKSQDCVI
jgi:hypothetical protein